MSDTNYSCPNCGKRLNKFKTGIIYIHDNKRFCSISCKKDYSTHNIKEFKCQCNQCKYIWHYLEEDEKKLKQQSLTNHLTACSTSCCSPIGMFFSNKAQDTQREIDKMKKCPKCNSSDITKNTNCYEKKT